MTNNPMSEDVITVIEQFDNRLEYVTIGGVTLQDTKDNVSVEVLFLEEEGSVGFGTYTYPSHLDKGDPTVVGAVQHIVDTVGDTGYDVADLGNLPEGVNRPTSSAKSDNTQIQDADQDTQERPVEELERAPDGTFTSQEDTE